MKVFALVSFLVNWPGLQSIVLLLVTGMVMTHNGCIETSNMIVTWSRRGNLVSDKAAAADDDDDW